jgi:hypothetical protein
MAKYALDYRCYIPLVLMTCKQVSNHLHHFIGPSKLNPGLTYNDVRSSRCTTAEITDVRLLVALDVSHHKERQVR